MAYGVSSLLWFAAIVAMIPLALWLLRRTPLGAAAAGQAGLRAVGSLPLGAAQRVVTVEAGSGDERRWLVLGVTAQSITLLHSMAPQGSQAPGTTDAATAPFAQQLLARLRAGGRP